MLLKSQLVFIYLYKSLSKKLSLVFLSVVLLNISVVQSQLLYSANKQQRINVKDSVAKSSEKKTDHIEIDTLKIENRSLRKPRTAAIRSVFLPGLGQTYNMKIWKVPIVYAALGGTGVVFVSNVQWYIRLRDAYRVADNILKGKDTIGSIAYKKLDEQIRRVYFESTQGIQANYIRKERDDIRKYVDYSAIYFIIAWALNVVDATVDEHLSGFDVSPDLSFKVKPGYSMMSQTAGLSLVISLKP
ncbi:DUF5683 domain-containing protein [Niabella aquatica]